MRTRRRYTQPDKEFSEINITPFTDVILVLLVIFMITSPFLLSGAFNIKLPKAVSAETQVNQGVEVYLSSNNEYIIDNVVVPPSALIQTLKVDFVTKGSTEVIVKADQNVLHGQFVKLLDLVKTAGASKILIATTKVAPAAGQ
jgi:biopolymer transport protein ExbD